MTRPRIISGSDISLRVAGVSLSYTLHFPPKSWTFLNPRHLYSSQPGVFFSSFSRFTRCSRFVSALYIIVCGEIKAVLDVMWGHMCMCIVVRTTKTVPKIIPGSWLLNSDVLKYTRRKLTRQCSWWNTHRLIILGPRLSCCTNPRPSA